MSTTTSTYLNKFFDFCLQLTSSGSYNPPTLMWNDGWNSRIVLYIVSNLGHTWGAHMIWETIWSLQIQTHVVNSAHI